MQKHLFPFLIAISALAVSGSAAFYSVYGLSKLFAGASFQVMIMAGSLEFAKLVVASLLYQYWDTINKGLRAYLSIACFILILITSGGIYGFLSGAYQSTANQSELLDRSLMILNQKQVRFEEQKQDLKIAKQSLTKSISDLRIALSNPTQVQYIDKESGTLITTSSSSARRALQAELNVATNNRDDINIKVEAVMDSINRTDMALLDKEISNEAESKLGPLKYLAETTGKDMGQVVNWFLLLIIFVFDPLAIALVIAANMAFAQLKPPDSIVRMSVPEGLDFNKQYPVSKSVSPITASIKVDKQDVVMDNLEDLTEGQRLARGLDTFIDVLEQEEDRVLEQKVEDNEIIDTPAEDVTTEHELYHGKVKESEDTVDYLSSGTRRRVIKKKRNQTRNKPKGYGYKG